MMHSMWKCGSGCFKRAVNYSALKALLGLLLLINCVTCKLDHHARLGEGPIEEHTNNHPAASPYELELTAPSDPQHRIGKRSIDQPIRIHLHYDASIQNLEKEKISILKNTVFPEALGFWQRALKVRRTEQQILLKRECLTDNYFEMKNDPHRYCEGSCNTKRMCGHMKVPQDHLDACRACDDDGENCRILPNGTAGAGILNSDFVLYVSAIQTDFCSGDGSIYATGHCEQEPTLDRPIAGHVNLCANKLNEKVEKLILYLKIQLVHPLAFTRSLFRYFRDDDGAPLSPRDSNGRPLEWEPSNRTVQTVKRLDWRVSGGKITREVEMIVTPRVVKEVRRHFNCSDLEGAELEDQVSMPHWEKRVFGNEAMTYITSSKQIFSRITFAMLEDSGWYRANYDMTEDLSWGRNLGCNFVKKSCMHWMMTHKDDLSPFCNKIESHPLSETHCTHDHSSVGVCNLNMYEKPLPAQYRIFGVVPNNAENDCSVTLEDLPHYGGSIHVADYCPFVHEFTMQGDRETYCYDEKNNPNPDDNLALEEYGNRSKCFYHTKSKWEKYSSYQRQTRSFSSGCYRYSCDNGLLRIFVRNVTFSCDEPGKELKIEMTVGEWTHKGGIKCPAFNKICGE